MIDKGGENQFSTKQEMRKDRGNDDPFVEAGVSTVKIEETMICSSRLVSVQCCNSRAVFNGGSTYV